MKMSFTMDNKLAPMGGSRGEDPYSGFRLGKAAVTASQFPWSAPTVSALHDKWNRHFIRLALQMMNENRRVQSVTRDEQTRRVKFVATSWTTLSTEELTDALWECVPDGAVNWTGEFEGPRSVRLSRDRMDRAVRRAVSYAQELWDPHWEAENRRRARKGGQTSTRGQSVTVEAVSAHLEAVQHLPERRHASAIAALLTAAGTKASARTVKRRLDDMKAIPEAVEPQPVEQVMTEPQDLDRPDSFDTFYALFNDWKDDIDRRTEGDVDVVEEMSGLLDDLLAP